MKSVDGNVNFLSPFDVRKTIEVFTDASKDGGLGFVLCQPGEGKAKSIIQCGYTSLTSAQQNYSVSEAEMLGVLWELEKCKFYTKGAPNIVVYSDHSALTTLTKKELVKIPNQWLVNMLEKLAVFRYEVKNLPGNHTFVADFIS